MRTKVLLLSAAAALMLAGCNDYVGKEKSHPLVIKAGKEKSAGEYKEAARCYEEFLLICPKSSYVHTELANLYNDYLNDPLQAVYHYRKWLEMNPNDKTSYEDIRISAETAQKNLFKKLKEEYKDSAEAKKADEEVQKLKDQLAQAQNSLKQYEEQNQKMKEKLLAVKEEREKLNAQTIARNRQNQTAAAPAKKQQADQSGNQAQPKQTAQAAGKTPARTSAAKTAAAPAKSQPAQPAGAPGTYKVQRGDTLMGISKKCYGNKRYYYLIVEANRAKLGPKNMIRAGHSDEQSGTKYESRHIGRSVIQYKGRYAVSLQPFSNLNALIIRIVPEIASPRTYNHARIVLALSKIWRQHDLFPDIRMFPDID